MRRALRAGAAGLLLATLAPAHADPPATGWRLAPRVVRQDESYVEQAPSGAVLDTERGTLSGAGVALARLDPQGRWQLDGLHVAAGIAYAGASQTGLPVSSRTQVAEDRWSLGRRQEWQVDPGWLLAAELALDVTRRDRDIAPTAQAGGAREKLTGSALRGGLAARWRMPPAAWVEAGAQASGTLPGQRLHVDLEGYADPVDLRPAARYGAGASLSAGVRLASGLELVACAEGWRERVGASAAVADYRAGQPLGTVRYPGATLWQHRLAIGLEWRPGP